MLKFKFKFLDVDWDFTLLISFWYIVVGISLICWPFVMLEMGWWNVPAFFVFMIWIGTCDHVSKKL